MNTQLLLRVCKSLGISYPHYSLLRVLIYDVLEEARIVEVSQCVQGHADIRLLDQRESPSLACCLNSRLQL